MRNGHPRPADAPAGNRSAVGRLGLLLQSRHAGPHGARTGPWCFCQVDPPRRLPDDHRARWRSGLGFPADSEEAAVTGRTILCAAMPPHGALRGAPRDCVGRSLLPIPNGWPAAFPEREGNLCARRAGLSPNTVTRPGEKSVRQSAWKLSSPRPRKSRESRGIRQAALNRHVAALRRIAGAAPACSSQW